MLPATQPGASAALGTEIWEGFFGLCKQSRALCHTESSECSWLIRIKMLNEAVPAPTVSTLPTPQSHGQTNLPCASGCSTFAPAPLPC